MPERLRSNMWSAETLLRGVRTVGQQPSAELLASNDPELLQELKVFGCQNLWWEAPPRILVVLPSLSYLLVNSFQIWETRH